MVLLGEGIRQAVDVLHQRQGEPVEVTAGGGQGDVRAVAFDECDVELFFKRADLNGDRRLAGEDSLRSPGDASLSSHVAKRPKLPESMAPGLRRPQG